MSDQVELSTDVRPDGTDTPPGFWQMLVLFVVLVLLLLLLIPMQPPVLDDAAGAAPITETETVATLPASAGD